jgi:N-acyl-D-amino-acid deacylase
VSETIRIIEEANAEGQDVAFDVYPYTASCTSLHAILPPWVQDGGKKAILERLANPDVRERIKREFLDGDTIWENTVAEDTWENIAVSGLRKPENKRYNHKRMSEIAQSTGKDPADAAFDILLDEGLEVIAVFHEMSEDDVETVISHPLASVGSDGESTAPYGPCGEVAEHPRAYGTFPRAIRRYVYERGLMPLEEMIRKMTSAPAARMGITDRGVISEGKMADIVLFDPERIRDKATFENPHQYSEGVVHVIVNGVMTVEGGEHTKERAGMIIRNERSG